jgi:hypothetical protein
MTGWLALHGGGEFQRGSEIGDRRLVVAAGGADARVIVVPAAAAREHPEMAARGGVQWFKQIGARAEAVMVVDALCPRRRGKALLTRPRRLSPAASVLLVERARLASLAAIAKPRARRCSASCAARWRWAADVEPAYGRPMDGLGLVPIVTLPRAEGRDRARALRLQLDRATRLFGIAERTSAIWDGSRWNVWGPGEVIEVLVDDVKTYQSEESFL